MPSELVNLVQQAGTTVGALGVVLGGLWWLVGPRLQRQLADLSEGAHRAQEQLEPNTPGSTAAHAAQAARASAEVPRLRGAVEQLLSKQEALEAERLPERLMLVERLQENHDRRLAGLEQLLIEQLGQDLAAIRRTHRRREAADL